MDPLGRAIAFDRGVTARHERWVREPYDAELYELTHRGNPGDVDFYRAACREARSVLELGSGYGRIAIALAEAGHDVVGIELDAGLLERARLNAAAASLDGTLEFIQGDMTSVNLGRRFDRVLIPHSGLYCLLELEQVRAALRVARAHLTESGLLLLDGYAADDFHEESEPEDIPEDALEAVAQVETAGRRYSVFEKSRWDRERQLLWVTYVYTREPSGEERRFDLPQRYLLQHELRELLAEAGFDDVLVRGGFEGEPYDEDAEHLVVAASPAQSP